MRMSSAALIAIINHKRIQISSGLKAQLTLSALLIAREFNLLSSQATTTAIELIVLGVYELDEEPRCFRNCDKVTHKIFGSS
jgi:hypothetical protein